MNRITYAILVGLLCGLLSVSASASTSYLCLTDMDTGFAFDKDRQQWHSVDFRAESKYVVSKATTGAHAWEVKQVGYEIPFIVCTQDFNELRLLFCAGIGDFRMNKHTLRFLYSYPIGYWNTAPEGSPHQGLREGADAPHMAIGKCSPLTEPVATPQDIPPQAGPSPKKTRVRRP